MKRALLFVVAALVCFAASQALAGLVAPTGPTIKEPPAAHIRPIDTSKEVPVVLKINSIHDLRIGTFNSDSGVLYIFGSDPDGKKAAAYFTADIFRLAALQQYLLKAKEDCKDANIVFFGRVPSKVDNIEWYHTRFSFDNDNTACVVNP